MWLITLLTFVFILFGFILRKSILRGRLCNIRRDISNKVIVLTGGSKGIGEETLCQLAPYNCKIYFGSRTQPSQLLNELSKINKNIKFFPLNLQDFDSIKQFVKLIENEVNHIDILINNAGILAPLTRQLLQNGLEVQFGTNYVGPFYLTQLLCQLLKKSQSPRIINVSSIAHTYEQLNLLDINCERWANSILWSHFYTYRQYGNTKLALILNAQELSNRTGIKACSLHPGVVRSHILQYQMKKQWFNFLLSILWPFFCYFTKDCYYGCQTTLYCIMLDDDHFVDGGFYDNCQLSKPYYTNKERAKQLWNFTTSLIEKIQESKRNIN